MSTLRRVQGHFSPTDQETLARQCQEFEDAVRETFDTVQQEIADLDKKVDAGDELCNCTAADISYDKSGSGLVAINVQDALDELDADIDAVEGRLDALEAAPVLFMGRIAVDNYATNQNVTLENELTSGGTWTNEGDRITVPVTGLYKFVIGGLRVQDNNTSTGRYSTADFRRLPVGGGGSVGIGNALGAREATTTANVISGAFYAQCDAGDKILIRFGSGSGTTVSAAAFQRRFTIEKVGD